VRTPLAWRNVTHRMVSTIASTSGVAFAIMLLFMQLGFYDVCFRASTMLYDPFLFDVALTSPRYAHMRASVSFPRRQLVRARACGSVTEATPLYVASGVWRTPQTWIQKEMVVLGVDPASPGFRLPEMARNAHHLSRRGTALGDVRCQRSYGDIRAGMTTEVSGKQIEIVATYDYGSGFVCDGSMVVGEATLGQISAAHSRDAVAVGLLRLAAGADVEQAIAQLRRELGPDVRVWSRPELEANEQRFFVKLRPIGMMFFSGVLLALAVGAMILYQILSTEVMNCIKQYATLRAMGYDNGFLAGVVVQQAAILAILGYIPAVIAAEALYVVTGWVSYLPITMTWARRGEVLLLSIGFCVISGVLVSWKALRADPAELF
jgi:putative ABC transport system permease protein